MEVKQAATLAFKNREALEEVNFCSCYQCAKKFTIEDIKEWTDGNVTAICPHCGVDSVLPGNITDETLKQMKEYWFGNADKQNV